MYVEDNVDDDDLPVLYSWKSRCIIIVRFWKCVDDKEVFLQSLKVSLQVLL